MKTFLWAVLIHLLYLTVGFLFLLPLWWALASSLRPLNDIFKYVSPFSLFGVDPPADSPAASAILRPGCNCGRF